MKGGGSHQRGRGGRGHPYGRGAKERWTPKAAAKKLRDGDGLAEPADSAKLTSPASSPSPSVKEISPTSPAPDPERPPSPTPPAHPERSPSPSPLVKEEVSPPSPSVTSSAPIPAPSVKKLDPIPLTHPSSQVACTGVPSTLKSEKGTATVLTRKGDRDSDCYTVARTKGTKQLKAAPGSPALSSSSQHSSSSRRQKFKKVNPAELDELAEQSKKTSEKLKKEQRRRQQQQQQQHHLRQQEQPDSIESRMKNFLGSFAKESTQGFFYVKKIKFMRDLGSFKLEVDFSHIIQHDIDLAIDIVNHKSLEKLQAAAREFMKMHVSDKDKNAAIWRGSMVLASMPDSIIPVTELLQDQDALFDVYNFSPQQSGCTLSIVSAAILGGFSEHVMDTHLHFGRAWNGDYDLKHMYVINKSVFVIMKKPSTVLEGDRIAQFIAKKADLNKLKELFTPYLDCRNPEEKKSGEPPQASELPLFYMQFCNDIEDVSMEEISQPWFKAYILNSPTLKMPQARHNFVCASHLALKRPVRSAVRSLMTKNPCPGRDDWRKSISESTNDVLRHVYHYRENGGEETASGSGQKQAVSGSGLVQVASGSGLEQAANEPSLPPYSWNIKGIITYHRNLMNHGSEKGLFKSIAEVEVFASTKLFEYLPKFVKDLFVMEDDPLIKDDLKGDFADILSNYKSSRVRTIDGLEVKPVPQLCYWEFEE